MKTVVQFLPYRRIVPDGVGDYGSLLATELRKQNIANTIFLAASPKDYEGSHPDGHTTFYLNKRTSAECLLKLNEIFLHNKGGPLQIILHLSGYGYQKRGAPLWLLKSIRRFRRLHPNVSILTVLHEINAKTFKPWSSSFYLQGIQKYISEGIIKLSTNVVTPCEAYAREIKRSSKFSGDRIKVMPVFSTVGELDHPQQEKHKKLVLFGSRRQRNIIFSKYKDCLHALVAELGVNEIVSIGITDDKSPNLINNVFVRHTGVLSAQDVSRELAEARYGIINYDASRLGKSTVLAAMAAHNINVVCFSGSISASDGLIDGKNIIVAKRDLSSEQLSRLPTLSSLIYEWYCSHRLRAQASVFGALLNQA